MRDDRRQERLRGAVEESPVIIDAHVHLADRLTGFRRPLRHGRVADGETVSQWFPPSFDPPASPPEMLLAYMDDLGVDRAIVVQHQRAGITGGMRSGFWGCFGGRSDE
jgi:hypothetical protein